MLNLWDLSKVEIATIMTNREYPFRWMWKLFITQFYAWPKNLTKCNWTHSRYNVVHLECNWTHSRHNVLHLKTCGNPFRFVIWSTPLKSCFFCERRYDVCVLCLCLVFLSQIFVVNFEPCVTLTLKYREMHGCVVNTVATDALVLKHQAISIHNAD